MGSDSVVIGLWNEGEFATQRLQRSHVYVESALTEGAKIAGHSILRFYEWAVRERMERRW